MGWESFGVVGFDLDPTPEDSQPMTSYRLVYHPKPLGPIISEL